MAERGGMYGYGGGQSSKRKKDDSPSPAAGSSSTPSSYNSVGPSLSEFELAKQKAQEIAARLLNIADPSKRPRVENGSGGGGFDSSDYGSRRSSGFGFSGLSEAPFTGYQASSRKIEIPNSKVGVIIGKGGETIKYLQLQSGAKIQVTRDMDADFNSAIRDVELMGTADQIAKAEQLINDVLSEAEAGGSRRVAGQPSGAEQFVMKIPNNKVGLVIGKGGETIKNMQASTGARIQVIPLHLPPGDMSRERTVQIDGTSEQIEAAKQLVEEVTSENRGRNPSMPGGYSQQGYQARPPSNWGPPGPPMPQPGYGYGQPGAYPGPPPQYNMNQPPYSGYPPPPSSGGYSTGWGQPTTHDQQSAHAGGYDYYNQQPPQPPTHGDPDASADGFGYGYGQVPPYGQGHGQDGYGYQSGSEYDQQYSSSYGAPSVQPSNGNPSYEANGEANQAIAPGQSYGSGGQPPVSNPSQTPSSQGGYGTQLPSGYGSYGPSGTQPLQYGPSQQSPSGVGGGGGYSEGNYPQPQACPPVQQPTTQAPTYPSTQWASPSSGYQFSQQGYARPPSYWQPPPPQYSSGYSQPQALSDGSTGGYVQGGSGGATPPQTSNPPITTSSSAGAKSSPPS